MISDTAILFREFLRSPITIGAIAPSSAALASVAAPVPSTGDPLVVELGPGTGAFTRVIQEKLDGRGTHLVMEINERLAGLVSRRWPGAIVVNDDAAHLQAVLAERGLAQADLIVSALPWASFTPRTQDRLLAAVAGALRDGGTFTTFTYVQARVLPPAVRFLRKLRGTFDEVTISPTVWRNLPPAVVYRARSLASSS